MKKILVLHTGGTIAMQEDPLVGNVITATNPLLALKLPLPAEVKLIIEDYANIPSPYVTPEFMLGLKNRILAGLKDHIDGVVITHGTDTLEETAYFLDITIGHRLPIILTGAMRSSDELGSDGLYNFLSAIRVASCDESLGKGTLVVMNDEIHTARFVTKTHTTNVATFRTPTFGPIGLVTKNKIAFFQQLVPKTHVNVPSVAGRIPIVKAYAGMDGTFLSLLLEAKIDGLVIEALGAGNLPPQTISAIKELRREKLPIVLVSRCFNGMAEGVYGYIGGGKQLQKLGILFCNELNSQKARIKLLIGLNAGLDETALAQFITD